MPSEGKKTPKLATFFDSEWCNLSLLGWALLCVCLYHSAHTSHTGTGLRLRASALIACIGCSPAPEALFGFRSPGATSLQTTIPDDCSPQSSKHNNHNKNNNNDNNNNNNDNNNSNNNNSHNHNNKRQQQQQEQQQQADETKDNKHRLQGY
ncbi:unnamed protein product [Polarella glacialis]|uniref:Uncharacterized protein n=1 Tax=Polarella glacialis TaxID=89957 RepID=A0A813DBA4_POLGL|nr:unnamed protein product [Polarella glacialis]